MGVIKSFESGNSCSFSWRRQNDRSWKYEWQNIRYKIDPATKEIEEEVLGSITDQAGLAITVHKARIDFDKAAIDVSQVLCQVRPMLHYRVCAR
jgi:hypothetical protein